MAFPPQPYRESPTLPSIIVPAAGHFRGGHHGMPFGSSSDAMPIPGREMQEGVVPPPLPPPRNLPIGDAPYQPYHPEDRSKREYGFGSSSFTSGYGSMESSIPDERPRFERRHTPSSKMEHRDEGYSSLASGDMSRDSFHSGFGLHHNKFQFQSPADLHGDSLKKKLDPIRNSDRSERSPPLSILTSSVPDLFPRRPLADANPFRPGRSLPIHSRPILESPARMTDTPMYSAVSPRSMPFARSPDEQRSPRDGDLDHSPPRHRSRRNNSDDGTSTQGSYELHGAEDIEIDDMSSLKRLHIEDAYSVGQKRRAASPLSEETLPHGTSAIHGDMARRPRASPPSRLTTIPQGTSISSIPQGTSISSSISTASRSNSYMSTISIPPSSATTATSYGRRSPGAFSPGGASPTSCASPYATSASLDPSPMASVSNRPLAHTRNVSATSPRKLNEVQKPGSSKLHGFFMCECCPKKPKKFDTSEELNTHEAEKQYECSYCGNRFKNKNEAERHQNSLHVRRHSWSCSALANYDRAFHASTNRPGEADTCGYCGDDFPRSGHGGDSGVVGGMRHITDQDWEERIRHLQDNHKFQECNSSKKFFRADHFRQHLKHSHAGTSGKWTNMLENACMLEEDPTPR